jgi:SPP1 gp7 family putative phage head morphogenesis protein
VAAIQSDTRDQLASLGKELSDIARSDGPDAVTTALDLHDWEPLGRQLATHLSTMASDGARVSLEQLSAVRVRRGKSEDMAELLGLANEEAIEWAEDHAAELVGMHRNKDGTWSVSEQPDMAISKTTRDGIKAQVSSALEEGTTNDELADNLSKAWEFSDGRAERIARTETAFADLEGNRAGWRASGVVVGRRWSIGVGEVQVCDACESMDGVEVGIDEDFEEGNPPLHPQCRCDELPIVSDEE